MIVKLQTERELGPADHGRRMSLDSFNRIGGREGYKFELIDGKVYVSPQPNEPHDFVLEWLSNALHDYRNARPDVINRVSTHARVFVPNRPATTCPEPDLAAYHDYPKHTPWRERTWENISPALVIEVACDDLAKDFGRNVDLYEQVPSIREYWLIHDGGVDSRFLFRVYRRRGEKWQKPFDLGFGDTYTTRLLPGFSLLIDPDA